MKIVLCNGDSLGMPRENVSFINSWYFKLAISDLSKNYLFVNNFRRAFNTLELSSKDFLENYQPNIVILQVGIVDCAPRLYKLGLLIKIINRIPFVSKSFWKLSKRFKKRNLANADVPLDLFKKNITDYLTRCKAINIERCVIIKIQTPGNTMIKNNPDIIKAVHMYNKVFDEVSKQFKFVTTISPLSSGNIKDYIEDGYHVNETGFRKVFDDLKQLFNELE